MKTIVTIEARMGSSRLPGKVLMEVCGKPLLRHMIERVNRATLPDDVVVATTTSAKDDAIEALCQDIGCSYFRGSEEDITDRLIQTAKHHNAHVIVQTTGDCPLHDPEVIDEGIRVYRHTNVQYVSNRLDRSWPVGLDTQVYHLELLEEVARRTIHPEDREHGSYYIYTHPREFSMKNFAAADIYCPAKRWCLDYPEDFSFFEAVYERLYPENPHFSTRDVLALLESHPEIETINSMHPVDTTVYPVYSQPAEFES